jgi:hypothetical protein
MKNLHFMTHHQYPTMAGWWLSPTPLKNMSQLGLLFPVPSGKPTKNYGKSPCYQWVNPLFLWPFSIVFTKFTRPGIPSMTNQMVRLMNGSHRQVIRLFHLSFFAPKNFVQPGESSCSTVQPALKIVYTLVN